MEHLSIQKIIIRNRIRDHRRVLAITQEELANAVGVSRQSIISVETGKCVPSVPLALAISHFFQSDLEALFPIELTDQVVLDDTIQQVDLDALFASPHSRSQSISGATLPLLDVYQTDHSFVVEADVPGMTEDLVSIEIENNVLVLKCERVQNTTSETKEYYYREVPFGIFQRVINLPLDLDIEKAQATVKNGFLRLVIPKRVTEKPKVHVVKPIAL